MEVPLLDWSEDYLRPHVLDSGTDRMIYFVTPAILIAFATAITTKQLFGSPMQCWVPNEFEYSWEQYIETHCSIQNTYFIPSTEEVVDPRRKKASEIGYYQWVPIVLALQALSFYIPGWIWKTLNKHTGIDAKTIVELARSLRQSSSDREGEINDVVDILARALNFQGEQKSSLNFFSKIRNSIVNKLTTFYYFTKIFYLLNIVAQLTILTRFIGTGGIFWGVDMIGDMVAGRDWDETGLFPRVTLCDVKIRKFAQLHKHTFQCVLMINAINEKIYLIIWLWLSALFVLSSLNVFYSALQIAIPACRLSLCKDWPLLTGDKELINRFAREGLKKDGILIMLFIESHTTSKVTNLIANKLLKKFQELQNSEIVMVSENSTADIGIEMQPVTASSDIEMVPIAPASPTL